MIAWYLACALEASQPDQPLVERRSKPLRGVSGVLSSWSTVATKSRFICSAELEAEQMKRDFVATVSHELRTPLTPLKGLLQSLNKGLVDDSPQARREYHAIMLRQAERLERLISDLLDVSRFDDGHLPMEAVPVEVVRSWSARSRTRAN